MAAPPPPPLPQPNPTQPTPRPPQTSHQGLTEAEAKRRLGEFGPNTLPEASINPLVRFLGYLWNPLAWAMELAFVLAVVMLDYADFALIGALLLLNAAISFVEESNADKAIKALAGALAPKCKVRRDGQVRTMDAADVVPGDVLVVKFGDVVPADLKLLGDEQDKDELPMQIDQAALTGESLPAKKFTGDVAFSGSTVKQGERDCVVYATGVNTFFGRAAVLISGTNNVANIQKIMTRIGAVCLVTIALWVTVELAVQFALRGHVCRAGLGLCPTVTNILVVIVGGIPIAMPTVLSVTLALGAGQLAKHGAIVARMSAVEEMAGMDILCSDKTGTLTLNKLSVERESCTPMAGHDLDSLLRHCALSANVVTEEPIDLVLYNSYEGRAALWDENKLLKYVPFNPTDKYTMAIIEDASTLGRKFRVMKGAPQVVLKRAWNAAEIEDDVEGKIAEYASRGFRALGVGLAEGEGPADAPGTKWDLIGLVPLFDPPRHDTKETIERCQAKGISVKMVTGDQQAIGIETAKQLGMGTNIYKVEALLKAKQGGGGGGGLAEDGASADELVVQADGFAEVFPEHKYEIVKILQDQRHMVGMTGDGVNDAPALKKADVGIAVHGATDAARGAADIVLTEPGLSVIVAAVIGARKIFQRMTTYAKYAVAMTFRICFSFGLLSVIFDWYFPTILIVLLAVFNDGAMIALSKDRVRPSDAPNTWNLRNIFVVGVAYGLYLSLSTLVLYVAVARTPFTTASLGGYSLQDTPSVLAQHCTKLLQSKALSPTAPIPSLYPEAAGRLPLGGTLLDQCITEQAYVRQSQQRSLIYAQVSISGQALVFVTRSQFKEWSPASRAGALTYFAFFGAQVLSSIIAALGFNGYSPPPEQWAVERGQLTARQMANGGMLPVQFFDGAVPLYGTEGRFTASVLGCTYYVLLAWVWAIVWHVLLDPIKWIACYSLNDDGVRSRKTFLRLRPRAGKADEHTVDVGAAAANFANPLGRASMQAATPGQLARASVIKVEQEGTTGLRRVSALPYQRDSAEARAVASQLANVAAATTAANPLVRLGSVTSARARGDGGRRGGGGTASTTTGEVTRRASDKRDSPQA
jgi:H+-transporting ATPase